MLDSVSELFNSPSYAAPVEGTLKSHLYSQTSETPLGRPVLLWLLPFLFWFVHCPTLQVTSHCFKQFALEAQRASSRVLTPLWWPTGFISLPHSHLTWRQTESKYSGCDLHHGASYIMSLWDNSGKCNNVITLCNFIKMKIRLSGKSCLFEADVGPQCV